MADDLSNEIQRNKVCEANMRPTCNKSGLDFIHHIINSVEFNSVFINNTLRLMLREIIFLVY